MTIDAAAPTTLHRRTLPTATSLLSPACRPLYDALVREEGAQAANDCVRLKFIDEYRSLIQQRRYQEACEHAAMMRRLDWQTDTRDGERRDLKLPLPLDILSLLENARPFARRVYEVGVKDPAEAYRLSEGERYHAVLLDRVNSHSGKARLPFVRTWQARKSFCEMLGETWRQEESRIKGTARRLVKCYRPLAQKLSPDSQAAIAINAERSFVNAALNYPDYAPEPFEPLIIRSLDRAFIPEARLPMDITVYRGINPDRDREGPPTTDEVKARAAAQEVDTYSGFQPTSLSRSMAKAYGPIVYEIAVPAGAPALCLDALLPRSRHVPVHEVLFPRNSRLKLLDAREVKIEPAGLHDRWPYYETLLVRARYLPPE